MVNALDMAIRNRRPGGQQPTPQDPRWKTPVEVFGEQLRSIHQPGVATTGCIRPVHLLGLRGTDPLRRPPAVVGTVGDGLDNAMMESFWSSIQIELLNRRRWKTRVELANAIFEFIERPCCPIAYAARSRAARCDFRVGARGCPVHQASSRSRLTAVAVRTCARAVFRSPV